MGPFLFNLSKYIVLPTLNHDRLILDYQLDSLKSGYAD